MFLREAESAEPFMSAYLADSLSIQATVGTAVKMLPIVTLRARKAHISIWQMICSPASRIQAAMRSCGTGISHASVAPVAQQWITAPAPAWPASHAPSVKMRRGGPRMPRSSVLGGVAFSNDIAARQSPLNASDSGFVDALLSALARNLSPLLKKKPDAKLRCPCSSGRAGQGRAGQGRAGQGRAGQGNARRHHYDSFKDGLAAGRAVLVEDGANLRHRLPGFARPEEDSSARHAGNDRVAWLF